MSSGKSFALHDRKSSSVKVINNALDHLEVVVKKLEKELDAQRVEMYNLSTLACELMESRESNEKAVNYHKGQETEKYTNQNYKERCNRSAVIIGPSEEQLIVDQVEQLACTEVERMRDVMQEKVDECVSVLSSLLEHNEKNNSNSNYKEFHEINKVEYDEANKPAKSQTLRQPVRSPRHLTDKERLVTLSIAGNTKKEVEEQQQHEQELQHELNKLSNARRRRRRRRRRRNYSVQYGERTLPFVSVLSPTTTSSTEEEEEEEEECETILSALSETTSEHLPMQQERYLSCENNDHAKQSIHDSNNYNDISAVKCGLESDKSMTTSAPSLNASTITQVSEYNSANDDELQPINNVHDDDKELYKTCNSIMNNNNNNNNSTFLSCGLSADNCNTAANHTTVMTDSSTTWDKSFNVQEKVYQHDALEFLIDTFSQRYTHE